MKILHLSDLHLGKTVNGYSMIEDQEYILDQIIGIIRLENADGVIIAGDIYDRSVPPEEAVKLFDSFLNRLHELNVKAYIISGNHDSAERLAFGSRLMEKSGTYLSPVYDGNVKPIEAGENVCIYMLPFIKPSDVRRYFPDEQICSYTDAVKTAIAHMDIDPRKTNILVTHQFVTGAKTSESEYISVGGTDNVDLSVFDPFDYTALGHLHRPQHVGRENIRYCGTPLKYSFSEINDVKSVTVLDIDGKDSINIRQTPLRPMRDIEEIKGTYNEITSLEFRNKINTDNYMHIILTDESDIPFAASKLLTIYKKLMKLDYDNTRTKTSPQLECAEDIEYKTPEELFAEFYAGQNGTPMNGEQSEFIRRLMAEISEEAVK